MNHVLIDFIENFFGRSCEEVGMAVSADPQSLLSRKTDFLELISVQKLPSEPQPLEPGELRPLVSNRISDLATGGIMLSPVITSPTLRDGDAHGFTLDVRSLLLYAHTVAIPNPFQASIGIQGSLAEPNVALQTQMSEEEFLFSLDMMAQLAPLIRHDIVLPIDTMVPRESALPSFNAKIAELIPQIAMQLVAQGIFTWSDQTDLNMRARVLAERFLRQDLVLATQPEDRLTRLLSCHAEAAAMPAMLTIHAGADASSPGRDPWLIEELVRLQLQGAGRIRLADMVAIRDDECFSVFRRDMAAAVHESSVAPGVTDAASQQTVVADEMRAAAHRLNLQTRRSTLLSSILGDALNWAVGAVVGGMLGGWTGAISGLAAKGTVDLVRAGPKRSERAMRAHYVELSKPPTAPAGRTGRERLLNEGR
ncbi:hypothetical protein Cs7R123_47850 [Catellatospora sp. TT07R-123]|uniref:hypothetical protein n=1 Tax=Catellatospora sp. TT07R-123 TaxID=2733863 RepID=UPI001B237EB4|nr:hypothetical protein [Catellatospora sp. TT07R-123]GHJ47443.1 hypothetical protein Cs7R123_47850 [Catellatospora sp. TT07R-123]